MLYVGQNGGLSVSGVRVDTYRNGWEVPMLHESTICPVRLARDLDGLLGAERIAVLRLYVSRLVASMLASPDDTDLTLRASSCILWLYVAIDAA